jgi:hypothetical protein
MAAPELSFSNKRIFNSRRVNEAIGMLMPPLHKYLFRCTKSLQMDYENIDLSFLVGSTLINSQYDLANQKINLVFQSRTNTHQVLRLSGCNLANDLGAFGQQIKSVLIKGPGLLFQSHLLQRNIAHSSKFQLEIWPTEGIVNNISKVEFRSLFILFEHMEVHEDLECSPSFLE